MMGSRLSIGELDRDVVSVVSEMQTASWIGFRHAVQGLTIGKRLPNAVYLFRTALSLAPVHLQREVTRAFAAAQPDPQWNIVKFHGDQFALTFLSYPDFDSDPHPALAEATKINLNTGAIVRTDYRARINPPILHRKESFLSPNDPRVHVFAALTEQEEIAGLYRDTTRIGLRVQWLTLLKRLGYSYLGHRLVRQQGTRLAEGGTVSQPTIERHRTAIKRYDLSKPIKILLERGLLSKRDSFFDYGCGHGMDVEALSNLGYQANGWDPAFRPDTPRRRASVVNLGYVLNVIEEPRERLAALREAYSLAERLLLVSTMVAGQENTAHTRAYRDGFLTKSNTFQKFYVPGELESLIEQTLGADVSTLGLGICAVFRNADEAELFEAGQNRRRINWTEISAHLRFSTPISRKRRQLDRYELNKELFDQFWQVMLDLGRSPEPGEFDRLREVRVAAGGLNKAVGLVAANNGTEMWQMAKKARSEDVLVYLAMTQFRKRFLRREIPQRIKYDIRSFFGDLNAAQEQARQLLFAAGDPGEVELAVEGLTYGVFDRDEMQFIFHRSVLGKLPPILRVYVHCGALRYGNPEEADLIKIHVRSGKLTFLQYDNFDRKRHPVLQTRIKINLRTQFVQVFDHSADKQSLTNKQQFTEAPPIRIPR
jgi:DNA phosphorothioation-associated putative methyltransferase